MPPFPRLPTFLRATRARQSVLLVLQLVPSTPAFVKFLIRSSAQPSSHPPRRFDPRGGVREGAGCRRWSAAEVRPAIRGGKGTAKRRGRRWKIAGCTGCGAPANLGGRIIRQDLSSLCEWSGRSPRTNRKHPPRERLSAHSFHEGQALERGPLVKMRLELQAPARAIEPQSSQLNWRARKICGRRSPTRSRFDRARSELPREA